MLPWVILDRLGLVPRQSWDHYSASAAVSQPRIGSIRYYPLYTILDIYYNNKVHRIDDKEGFLTSRRLFTRTLLYFRRSPPYPVCYHLPASSSRILTTRCPHPPPLCSPSPCPNPTLSATCGPRRRGNADASGNPAQRTPTRHLQTLTPTPTHPRPPEPVMTTPPPPRPAPRPPRRPPRGTSGRSRP